jgi:hypothetical protein
MVNPFSDVLILTPDNSGDAPGGSDLAAYDTMNNSLDFRSVKLTDCLPQPRQL